MKQKLKNKIDYITNGLELYFKKTQLLKEYKKAISKCDKTQCKDCKEIKNEIKKTTNKLKEINLELTKKLSAFLVDINQKK